MLIKLSRHHIAEVFVQRSCWRSSKVITSCFPFLYRQNQLPVYLVFSSFPREVSFERKLALSTGYYWIIWFSCQKLASARQHSCWMKSMHSGHVWMASWKLACARQCIQAVDFVSLGPGSLLGPGSHPNKPSLQYWGLLLLIRKQVFYCLLFVPSAKFYLCKYIFSINMVLMNMQMAPFWRNCGHWLLKMNPHWSPYSW